MGERLLLPVLILAAILPACATTAHAGTPGLEAAIARLEALEREQRDDAEAWHAKHHIVADGPSAALVDGFVKRVRPPTASLPHRHFAFDATPLGGGAREDGQAHFGQFALVVAKYSKDRALAADLAAGLRAAPRLAQTLSAIESLPRELASLQVPDVSGLRAWRGQPAIQAKKLAWSELDISWAVEAIARGAMDRDVARLIDSQVALYRLDRDFPALNFVPEHGVHILMMLCRVIPLLDAQTARRYKPIADAMFAELLALGAPELFTPTHYSMFGHLFEVAYDRDAYRPRIDADRERVVLERLLGYIESNEPKDYGFVTHTLRGLRNLSAARARSGEPRPASSR